MSGPLALVGGLPFTEGCTFDAGLLADADAEEVVVLPTASAYEDHAALCDRAEAWFASLGVRTRVVGVLTRPDAMRDEHVRAIRSSRCTYLAGSSPMHLRSVLKDSPLWDALVASWQDGGAIAGANAGADVLCDPMVDPRGGAFTVGLGLVGGLAVIPRSNAWSAEKIHRTVALARGRHPVVELPEATALLRGSDGTWRAEGAGQVVVHLGEGRGTLADLP